MQTSPISLVAGDCQGRAEERRIMIVQLTFCDYL
jgi:hypothetical protein